MNNGLDRKVQLTTGTQTNFADDEFPADLLVELDRSRPRTLRAQLERGEIDEKKFRAMLDKALTRVDDRALFGLI